MALTSSGEIWSWGGNGYGQLGDGTRQSRREPKRVRLPGHSKAKALAVGTDHVLVLTSRGDLVSWGRNHRGQLGLGRRSDGEATPQRVAAEPMRAVSAGDAISAAISANGRLHTWGRNGADQLALRGVVDAGTDALRPTRSPS